MSEGNKLEHLAIIMDGNRRWAKEKSMMTTMGHKKGADVLVDTAKYCNEIGLKYLTVYAFSTENWKRTEEEVGYLMGLLGVYLDKFLKELDMENIKINFIGNIDVIDSSLSTRIRNLEEKTANNTGLNLMIAFNYGGRDEIVRACRNIAEKVKNNELNVDDIDENLFSNHLYTSGKKDPDLVVRTSGEMRTSNFLPWQITYSEFLPLDKYWPDFTKDDVDFCVEEFSKRKIRKGK
ncbi:MAG: di-trans,poly-cis-decaprenylcistransferase [Clostridiales bacterium]|jgi:di-trans,poly-cis-decaprenylcistransferase|nr:di-trans,poly-cis-decaprenylcistransferase [Clostridiales bacterium]